MGEYQIAVLVPAQQERRACMHKDSVIHRETQQAVQTVRSNKRFATPHKDTGGLICSNCGRQRRIVPAHFSRPIQTAAPECDGFRVFHFMPSVFVRYRWHVRRPGARWRERP